MEKLASIQKIVKLTPIPNKDRIETATVLGWEVIVRKGIFNVNDLCIYICTDTMIPNCFINDCKEDKTLVRLKTIKMAGQISQGLILPVNLFDLGTVYEGMDISNLIGVTKYEKTMDNQWFKNYNELKPSGRFPTFLHKTDEVRIQSDLGLLEKLKGKPFYITIKLDGTSSTYYRYNGKFGVCSRNIEFKNPDDLTFYNKKNFIWSIKNFLKRFGLFKSIKYEDMNVYWKMAYKYKLMDLIPEGFAIQGEICGPGIQKNKLELPEFKLFVFNVFDINKGIYIWPFVKENTHWLDNLNHVPLERIEMNFDYSLEELLELAKGNYKDTNNPKEGIVVRSWDQTISFKVLNTDFLLKYGE